MGKLRRNEQAKLKASFKNTIAAGLLLAGVLIPVLAFYGRMDETAIWLAQVLSGERGVTQAEFLRGFAIVTGTIITLSLAGILRHSAASELDGLED